MSIADNFCDHCDRSGGNDACWPWLRPLNKGGYGQVRVNGRPILAHRYAYTLEKGLIPPGLLVMHSCDNPKCVNPLHLSVGTIHDNNADRCAKGRTAINRGSQQGRAVVNESQVKEIRRLLAAGHSVNSLSDQFVISPGAIRSIRARATWGWLPE